MKKVTLVVRVLLGILLIVFGLNKFLQFMPMPSLPQEAGEFMTALFKSGYIFPIVAIIEIGAGVLILINKYISLALVVLFPVMLNAFLFHLFLDVAGIGGAALLTGMIVYLLFANKEHYAQLLKA